MSEALDNLAEKFDELLDEVAATVNESVISELLKKTIELGFHNGEPHLYLFLGEGDDLRRIRMPLKQCVSEYEIDENETSERQNIDRKFIESIIRACDEWSSEKGKK